MNLSKIIDSLESDSLADYLINQELIWDLQSFGIVKVYIPRRVVVTNKEDLINSIKSRVEELWQDYDSNYFQEYPKISVDIEGQIIEIKVNN